MLKIVNSLIVITLISTLAACGGGSSGGASEAASSSNPSAPPEPIELLASTPILLPDLKPKYDRLCGRDTNARNVAVVDVNKDGRVDLIINLWCLQPKFGVSLPTDAPVPNGLVALIQNSQGIFEDKTSDVFGVDLPSIGGIGIEFVVNDFNGDGVKDIVYAVNREDGRLPDSNENQHSPTVALLSDGVGGYRISEVTAAEYGYKITLKENNLGQFDLVLTPFGAPSVFSYSNGWKKLQGFDWISNIGITFFRATSPGLGSRISVVPSLVPRTGVELYSLGTSGWNRTGSYLFPEPTLVQMKSYTGAIGLVPLFTVDGKDFVTPSIMDTCELSRSKDSASEALALYAANEVVGGYKGQLLDDSDNKTLKGTYNLLLFTVNQGTALTKIELPIKNQIDSGVIWKIECSDITKDGLSDIQYLRPMGGPPSGGDVTYPAIFVNDGSGKYSQVDTKWFPRPGNGLVHLFEDLNGDGIRDLLYYPLTGYQGDEFNSGSVKDGHPITNTRVRYFLYLGRRNLKSSDVM